MKPIRLLVRSACRFVRDERGAVLAEAIIVLPFISLLSIGILEFGSMFWQKEQIETGLRDAARYLARCQAGTSFVEQCSEAIAWNIAFYGRAVPGGAPLRVPGWGPATGDIVRMPKAGVVLLKAAHAHHKSPLFSALGIPAVTIEAYHEQRYIGW